MTPDSATSSISSKALFHLERADQVTGRVDDVIAASHEPVIAVFIPASRVTGVVEAVLELLPVHGIIV